ncbi:MAG: hypothetical protein JOZ37_09850 [Actinobacteria bacterium]|nr:hypothetical protein [Actinomycetota bacterium]MBV9255643.1 hypothetical protein [Actinomycetota bacterium]MBV9664259.1 hypothetical protein [Actinomycetota bacterium]
MGAVFVVGWGRLARSDWKSVLVKAHDPDEAMAIAAEAFPDRLRPEYAVHATEALERAVLNGDPLPPFWRGTVLP